MKLDGVGGERGDIWNPQMTPIATGWVTDQNSMPKATCIKERWDPSCRGESVEERNWWEGREERSRMKSRRDRRELGEGTTEETESHKG